MLTRPELLAAAGRALFGAEWQQPLARAVSVNPRTMRRWVAGDIAISDGVLRDLVAMVEDMPERARSEAKERTATATKVIQMLRAAIPPVDTPAL